MKHPLVSKIVIAIGLGIFLTIMYLSFITLIGYIIEGDIEVITYKENNGEEM